MLTPRGLPLLMALITCTAFAESATDTLRLNRFDDPFVQLTQGIADCPSAEGPLLTLKEANAEAHQRAERGNSCWAAGRCRYSSSFAYDKEIMERVQKAVAADGRFGKTTVWALGQRRWIWLKGCVNSEAEAAALVQLIGSIDDVQAVLNQLTTDPHAPPPYRTAD